MSRADAKAAVDAAFRDEVSKLFVMLVANMETQDESVAANEFATGFKYALRAYQIAITTAEAQLNP